jgi:hypothetical protein
MEQTNNKASPRSVVSSVPVPSVNNIKENESAPLKMYYIDCCGTGHMVMNSIRLNIMFEKMPTLSFLLIGHPHMRAEEMKQLEDGREILQIPEELGVSKSSFILLVNCIFGNVQLPRPGVSGSRYLELVETAATLGGCEDLEEQIKNFRPEPMTPQDDIHNEYYWAKLPHYSCYTKEIVAMRQKGYSWVQTIDVQFNGGSRVENIFRAPKKPPSQKKGKVESIEK